MKLKLIKTDELFSHKWPKIYFWALAISNIYDKFQKTSFCQILQRRLTFEWIIRWFMMFLVGIGTSLLAAGVHISVELVSHKKFLLIAKCIFLLTKPAIVNGLCAGALSCMMEATWCLNWNSASLLFLTHSSICCIVQLGFWFQGEHPDCFLIQQMLNLHEKHWNYCSTRGIEQADYFH